MIYDELPWLGHADDFSRWELEIEFFEEPVDD